MKLVIPCMHVMISNKPRRAIGIHLTVILLLVWSSCSSIVFAETLDWSLRVEELNRSAILHVPNDAFTTKLSLGRDPITKYPVVFVFHGHGGSSRNAQRTFQIEKYWPEAIAVYMQGIPTPGRLTDPEGKKNGWQAEVGDHHDRDLKFFDAVLSRLRSEFTVDHDRIYSTGHSNGGGFTYLLWEARGKEFAAFAPSAAAAGRRNRISIPKPILHLAGRNDHLVKYAWQEASIQAMRKLNGCLDRAVRFENEPWETYVSQGSTPVMAYIHDGEHRFPVHGSEMIVRFFKTEPWKNVRGGR
jgi:polyhydroxybutyrate depolymerase